MLSALWFPVPFTNITAPWWWFALAALVVALLVTLAVATLFMALAPRK